MKAEVIYNFGPGPAMLYPEVLREAHEELLDFGDRGMSIMEMSHRGAEFMAIAETAERDLRDLMQVPAHYEVLFLQGGATGQCAAVPMNLLRGKTSADYVNTGHWSERSIAEAKKYCDVKIVASSEDKNFTYAPKQSEWRLSKDAAYVHYVSNETIHGVEFHSIPEAGNVPLVADMSSNILSREIDVSRFGLIYAGAQKNIGPAGVTVVIVREDLTEQAMNGTPAILDYALQAKNGWMFNTPPTFAIYMAGLTFKRMKQQGGVKEIEKQNIAKAKLLYDYLDSTEFYRSPVAQADRSRMNVPFFLQDGALDEAFLRQAKERSLLQLKGHRALGGMRASIYNPMPLAGVRALVNFMREFERESG
ncbi:MAG: 3-phosphoserine/phosphohydroxythreonine transaminase [Burkholderiales bacterium]